ADGAVSDGADGDIAVGDSADGEDTGGLSVDVESGGEAGVPSDVVGGGGGPLSDEAGCAHAQAPPRGHAPVGTNSRAGTKQRTASSAPCATSVGRTLRVAARAAGLLHHHRAQRFARALADRLGDALADGLGEPLAQRVADALP